MDLKLTDETRHGVTIVTVTGSLDCYTAPAFREHLAEARERTDLIALDLNAADILDSTCLGVIVGNEKHLRAASRNGRSAIICTADRILKVFGITGLAKVLGIHPTADAAIADLTGATPMTTAPAPGSNPPLTSGPPTAAQSIASATMPVPPEAIDAALDAVIADLTAELHERGIVPAIVDREWLAGAITRAVGAAAPAIRAADRQRLLRHFNECAPCSSRAPGVIAALGHDRAAHLERLLAGTRQTWADVLADHYLMSVECDPVRKLDNPVCGCSRVFLGWHPSAGEARQAWISHVAGIADLATVAGTLRHGDRIAELEQLAAEILATFTKGSDGYRARAGQVQIAKWETTLKGPSS